MTAILYQHLWTYKSELKKLREACLKNRLFEYGLCISIRQRVDTEAHGKLTVCILSIKLHNGPNSM